MAVDRLMHKYGILYVLFSNMLSFYWRRITSHEVSLTSVLLPAAVGLGLITYLTYGFLVCWQCNSTFERFCWNTNAENSSCLGEECPYCLSKGKFIS